ncbi:MAG: SU10 major capsid protein [Thermodesulfobacteriota bacterium]
MTEVAFDFMKVWTQADQESERRMKSVLLDGLDAVVQAESDVLSRIKVDRPAASPVIRWMEEWGYPSAMTAQLTGNTMAFTGHLFGKSVTPGTVGKVIREGTILERPSGGCQVKIASLDGLVASVTAYGNTSVTDDTEPSRWDIISEVWSDYRDASDPRSLDRVFREVGTQVFAETFEIPKTRKNTQYQFVACEAEHQIVGLLGKLRRQLAYAVLRSRPLHNGSQFVYGDRTDEPTMCGLCTWPIVTQSELSNPSVYVNKNGQILTKADLDSLVRQLWLDEHADYNSGDWCIVCHPSTHQFIHDFDISHRRMEEMETGVGFRVEEFHSKIGKTFPILSERYMRPGALIVVNFDAFAYGYFAGDALERKEIPTQGRYQRWLISFQTYGVVARNPRANIGMIYGLPSQ